jgi:inorganic pyrophosphatase
MFENVTIGDKAPDVVNVIIEIPAGSKNKYEFDKEMQAFKLDRVGYSAMAHPYDYGYLPNTLSEDGDPLDAFVLLDHSVFPGCVVAARPIGVINMIDDGDQDEKLICVPADDVRYNHITELDQISAHIPKEIQHFFEHYKDLQGKKTEITEIAGADKAKQIIVACQGNYRNK